MAFFMVSQFLIPNTKLTTFFSAIYNPRMEQTVPLAYNYIRFSTAEQRKGDSLRRQDDLAKAYAEEKGLSLDESLTMLDLGVSAFKGANAESGALAAFLEAIDNGHVPVGSYRHLHLHGLGVG
ncbi:recombinase family protein [Dechloromonas sp. ZS-1]